MALAVASPAAALRVPRPRAARPRCRAAVVAAAGPPTITVVRQASAAEIARLGCKAWPTWSCAVSKFPWSYGETETSLLIEGAVTVTADGGEPVSLVAGDIATFPAGMSCVWHVTSPLRKHYSFD